MLDYDLIERAEGAARAPVMLLLHGRGADAADLAPLAERLGAASFVLPRAPFPAAPWGYGPGWAWYRFLGGDTPEPESFSTSLRELDALLDHLADRIGADRPLVLGGFSQGGTLSLGHALARPGRSAGVLNFSGFLANHPEVEASRQRAADLRVFWGHGTHDPAIPFALAQAGRERLREAGAALEARDYEIGHWIDPAELEHAAAWIRALVSG